MRDCPHCGESFEETEPGEVAFLEHLRDDHPAEFGPVDRRRLDQIRGGDDGGISATAVLLAGLTLVVVGVVVYVTFGIGGSSANPDGDSGVDADRTPSNLGAVHSHGTMEVVILGDSIDFSQDRYQLRADAFHFESGEGRVWHVHAQGVTLEWALATLGIDVTETSVTVDGTTYRDASPDYRVAVTVDGEPVDPSTYVLQGASDAANARSQGDHVRVVVAAAE